MLYKRSKLIQIIDELLVWDHMGYFLVRLEQAYTHSSTVKWTKFVFGRDLVYSPNLAGSSRRYPQLPVGWEGRYPSHTLNAVGVSISAPRLALDSQW